MQAIYLLNYKGSVCEVPCACVRAAVAALPSPENSQGVALEITTEIPKLERIRFTFISRASGAGFWFWHMARAYHLDCLPSLNFTSSPQAFYPTRIGPLEEVTSRLRHTEVRVGEVRELRGYDPDAGRLRLVYLGMTARTDDGVLPYWGLLKYDRRA